MIDVRRTERTRVESRSSIFLSWEPSHGHCNRTHHQKRTRRTFLTDARDDVLSTRGVVPRRRGVEIERGVRCWSIRRAGYRRAWSVGDGIVVAVAREVCHGAANDFFSSTTLDDDDDDDDDARDGDAGW